MRRLAVRRPTLALATLLLAGATAAQDGAGSVCVGANYAKIAIEHGQRLYLRVNNSPKLKLVGPNDKPRLALTGLELQKKHTVRVYLDGRVVQSWTFSFEKIKASGVLVWRSAGAWQTEPIDAATCTEKKMGSDPNFPFASSLRARPREQKPLFIQVNNMKAQYDFSTMRSRKNPYASKLKKPVTMRLSEDVVSYFKNMAEQSGVPYQSLINLYLRDCLMQNRQLQIKWPSAA